MEPPSVLRDRSLLLRCNPERGISRRMTELTPNNEEIQERFSRVFHLEMNRNERCSFLLGNKYWILGYLVGMEDGLYAEPLRMLNSLCRRDPSDRAWSIWVSNSFRNCLLAAVCCSQIKSAPKPAPSSKIPNACSVVIQYFYSQDPVNRVLT
jgi:hypothetical protein